MTPRDPVFGILYGPSGVGKTSDLLYSLVHALWLAAPGATASAEAMCGYSLLMPAKDIPTLDTAIEIMNTLATPKGKAIADKIDAVILDDLTLYVDRTIRALAKAGVGAGDPRQLWGAVRLKLLDLRDTARRVGKHVFMNAHEGPPKMVNGARVRGGPALPGAGAEIVPAACDLVLKASPNSNIPVGWPVEYRCDVKDQDYVSKDRHNVTPDHAPMNVGEILRAQGFTIRRHPDMPWQEQIVEQAANAMIAKGLGDVDTVKKILAATFAQAMKMQPKIDPDTAEKRAIWTQRDAYDRAILRAAQGVHRRRLYG